MNIPDAHIVVICQCQPRPKAGHMYVTVHTDSRQASVLSLRNHFELGSVTWIYFFVLHE